MKMKSNLARILACLLVPAMVLSFSLSDVSVSAAAAEGSGPEDGVYTIASSANESAVLDIEGGSMADMANLRLYGSNGTDAQKYDVRKQDDGTYRILVKKSGKALDVAGASSAKGANIQQYAANGTAAQSWVISGNGDGTYTLKASCSGLVMDAAGGRTADGTNLRCWTPNGTKAQKFIFEKEGSLRPLPDGLYTVTSALNGSYVLDIAGAKRANGTNLQLWNANGTNAQKFRLTYLGNTYYQAACVKTEKVLDAAGAGTSAGTNVQQYEWNGTDAQQWQIRAKGDGTYTIMAKGSGLYMDVDGGIASEGRNVQLWSGNGTKAQAFSFAETSKNSETPYDTHGKLRVKGASLCDSSGSPYQLRGISTHGIAWYPGYVSEDSFASVRDSWNGDVVRLAMYTAEYGGYCSGGDQNSLKNLIDRGVQAATDLGMYVIIDWHILSDSNPQEHQSEAVSFFREMSAKYASYGNVIYEICNEPNGGTGWDQIKSYANAVIPAIRANSPDSVIIVGTPNWSQYVEQAADSPLTGYSNIMYTLHFYAATHKEWLQQKLTYAVGKGLPVFVTEYGICDASGSGGIDTGSAQTWISLLNTYGISFCAWNLSNKNETSAMIAQSCTKNSGWSDSELSDSGRWIVSMMRNE